VILSPAISDSGVLRSKEFEEEWVEEVEEMRWNPVEISRAEAKMEEVWYRRSAWRSTKGETAGALKVLMGIRTLAMSEERRAE
jgi:hypothetical protein